MKRGVIVGKFYPPHKGHSYLIDSAMKYVDELTVIICEKKNQIIPGKLRKKWLKELHPNIKVLLMNYDGICEEDSKRWADITVKLLGYKPDYAFTSEEYGDQWCKYMGCKHILIDKLRKEVPVSGTLIRNDPFKYWKFISPCVRSYFNLRICVVGAESTGTTTLAADLAELYSTSWVPEYGRYYYEGKMKSLYSRQWETYEFIHICNMQNQMEDELAKSGNKVLICDTNSYATHIWHERYLEFYSNKVKKLSKNRNYELYILTGDEIPFVQDGTRDGEAIRHKMHQKFIINLKKDNKNFCIVNGNREERLKKSKQLIDNLIKNRTQLGPI